MKKAGITILASLLLFSSIFAQKKIVVSNELTFDRNAEIVEIKTCALKADFKTKSYILKNEKNQEVAYQLVSDSKNKQAIIFQADIKAQNSATYMLIEGKPAGIKSKTFGRFVPERADDFAWENDYAAYRMYGPALANENPSNGVDFWAKSTNELVVDKRYNDELKNGITYHVDHGNGLDFYKVAHTLGCGGIAPYAGDKLWVGNHYDNYKVLENGPLRLIFILSYDSVLVGKEYFKQTIKITTDAGSILNKAEVLFTGKNQTINTLASGIFLHDLKDNIQLNLTSGTLAYAENAVSNAGLPSGRNYVGIYVPGAKVISSKETENHALLLSPYKVGKTFTYYFGGGWSKWHFSNDVNWFKAVDDFSEIKKHPLKVKLK